MIYTLNKSRLTLFLLGIILFYSCSKDDPDGVNEQEFISNVILTIESPDGTQQTIDWDLSETNSQSINMEIDTNYNVGISFLNTSDPTDVEDVTLEIIDEADEHQVFFSAAGVVMEFVYMDFDSNGNPVGTQFVLAPLGAGSGSVTITLVHEPAKPNDGLDTAGGEIDIQTTFSVTVQ